MKRCEMNGCESKEAKRYVLDLGKDKQGGRMPLIEKHWCEACYKKLVHELRESGLPVTTGTMSKA